MIRKNRRPVKVWLTLTVFVLFFACTSPVIAQTANRMNIIFMVPDGLGLANVTAARIYKNGLSGGPLNLQTLETVGIQSTYSKNSTVTDSAPAASAWACGEKFLSGEICKHGDGLPNNPSILELARERKKSTGLVATSQITHATPASFGAHVTNRNCQNEIARQYIEATKPDLILGGGRQKWDANPATDPDARGCPLYPADLVAVAREPAHGYTFVETKHELDKAVASGKEKILGLFSPADMTPAHRRDSGTTEPTLAEMTGAALRVLERNPFGFFLVIEGSQIDWANHSRNMEYMVKEVLAFDEAVKVALDWIDDPKHPMRKGNTLIIIAPDHETGGFAVNGPQKAVSAKGNLSTIETGWTFHPLGYPGEAKHTGGDVVVYSQGPGSKREDNEPGLGRFFDNTELYDLMKRVMSR